VRLADAFLADLPCDEQNEQQCRRDQPGERGEVTPAVLLGFDQAPNEGEQRAGEQGDSGRVKPPALGLPRKP
jgi:hypothetical protein